MNGRVLDYNWTEGKWYRVKLEASVSDDELRAKIWPENETEPLYWMFVAELERMAAISTYGTKFVRKGKPGLRFALSDKILPQFKDILISPQEGT